MWNCHRRCRSGRATRPRWCCAAALSSVRLPKIWPNCWFVCRLFSFVYTHTCVCMHWNNCVLHDGTLWPNCWHNYSCLHIYSYLHVYSDLYLHMHARVCTESTVCCAGGLSCELAWKIWLHCCCVSSHFHMYVCKYVMWHTYEWHVMVYGIRMNNVWRTSHLYVMCDAPVIYICNVWRTSHLYVMCDAPVIYMYGVAHIWMTFAKDMARLLFRRVLICIHTCMCECTLQRWFAAALRCASHCNISCNTLHTATHPLL